MVRAENDFVRNRVAQRVGRVATGNVLQVNCAYLMCRFFLFSSIDLLKTSMVLKSILTLRGGGGAQSNGFGLVLLCNSTKTVLEKTCGLTFCV